jgi:hypothetical protein
MRPIVRIFIIFSIIIALIAAGFIYLANRKLASISPFENKLMQQIGFDQTVFQMIKDEFRTRIEPLNSEHPTLRGVSIPLRDNAKAQRGLVALKDELRRKGYSIYIHNNDYGKYPVEITVLNSVDPYDLLRFSETGTSNTALGTEKIISKLKEWDRLYGIEIIDAGIDFVELKLEKLPKNLSLFTAEIKEFTSSVINLETGNTTGWVEYLQNTHYLYLWWDVNVD